jgi:hypothetical protein
MGLSFTIDAGLRQRSHSQVRVPRDSWPHFTVCDLRPSQAQGQVPVLISPRNKVAQLCSQAMGSLFVASYDSQSYGGVFRPLLHTWFPPTLTSIVLLITPLHGPSRKRRFQQYLYCCMSIRCRGNMFTEPLPRNGSIRYNYEISAHW